MRTSRIRRRPVLTGLAALTLAVTAALPAGALAQDPSPVTGGTLIVAADGTAFPPNLNPAIATSNGVTYISSKVVEYLADAGSDGLVPRLATGWEGSDDGLSFTVHLRDGVKFSDGTPFTSADVKFSAEEAWKPLQNFGRIVLANLETVETPGSADRGVQVLQAHPAVARRQLAADPGRRPPGPHLPGDRLRDRAAGQPAQPAAHRHRSLRVLRGQAR